MNGRHRTSLALILLLLALAALAAAVLSLAVGRQPLPLRQVYLAMVHPGAAEVQAVVIVRRLRLTRTVLALLVGAALAVSGMVMQGFFQNPMANPYLLGVSSGASLGATVGLLIAPEAARRLAAAAPRWEAVARWFYAGDFGLAVSLLAFLGAVGVTFVVYLLSREGGRTPVTTLLLTGIALGSLASALSAYLYITRPDGMEKVILWVMGTFQRADGRRVWTMAAVTAGGAGLAAAFCRDLNVMQMGDETAHYLGVDVARVRKVLLVTASLLAAGAVAVVGVIGFVGLVVPHLMRLLTGPRHERLLPACVLGGGTLMLLADVAARLIHPAEAPVGIVTAFIGCPFFLYLLRRSRRGRE